MSLAYATAAFYINAISTSPHFIIYYHSLETLKYNASQSILFYINQESNGDLLFIFKKFPDIFALKENFVTLTDPFLTLHIFSKYPKGSWFVANFENVAMEYFKGILCHSGGMNFLGLFSLLITQNVGGLSHYFSKYTQHDIYNFFQNHSDVFLINNDCIYLRAQYFDKMADEIAKQELYDNINFLLTCFKDLHYIELKQCISYINTSVKSYLNQFSLVKQREIFENSPFVIMDAHGFLSLRSLEINISITNDEKIILLIICILAFEKNIHFEKIVQQVQFRLSPDYNYILCKLPIKNQFNYFRRYHQYFKINDDGYVQLASTLIFPECYFLDRITAEEKNPTDELISIATNNTYEEKTQTFNIQPLMQKCLNTVNMKSISSIQNAEALCNQVINNTLKPSSSIDDNIKHSILFLHRCYTDVNPNYVLKVLLHVFKYLQKYFSNLAPNDKYNFLEYCLYYMNIEAIKHSSCNNTPFNYLTDNEKILLLTTYMLLDTGRIYFLEIVKAATEYQIEIFCKMNLSDQFHYFNTINSYFFISDDGYVSLNSHFGNVNFILDEYYNVIEQIHYKFLSSVSENKQNAILNELSDKCLTQTNCFGKEEDSTNQIQCEANKFSGSQKYILNSSQDTEIHKEENTSLNNDIYVGQKAIASNKIDQKRVLKRIYHAFIYLKNSFEKLSTACSLQAVIHSLLDVHNYFFQLSSNDLYLFIQEIFLYINVKEEKKISANTTLDLKIKEKEKNVLFITYLLIEKNRLHFEKIFHLLLSVYPTNSTSKLSIKSQFKYIKKLNYYFTMSGDGYVLLSSIIINEKTAINSLKDFIPCNFPILSKYFCKETKAVDNSLCKDFSKMTVNSEQILTKENVSTVSQSLSTDISNVKNIIIDLCYSILSAAKEMHIEKLCTKLISFNFKSIQRFFSLMTLSDKIKFFKEKPCYFEVTKDNVVKLSLNIYSFVPLSNINPTEMFTSSCISEKIHMSEKAESLKSFDTSELSDAVSSGCKSDFSMKNKRRRRRKKGKSSILNSELSIKLHEPVQEECLTSTKKKQKLIFYKSRTFYSKKQENMEKDLTSLNKVHNKFENKKDNLLSFNPTKSELYNKTIMNHSNGENDQSNSAVQSKLESNFKSVGIKSVDNLYKDNIQHNIITETISTTFSCTEKDLEISMPLENKKQFDTCEDISKRNKKQHKLKTWIMKKMDKEFFHENTEKEIDKEFFHENMDKEIDKEFFPENMDKEIDKEFFHENMDKEIDKEFFHENNIGLNTIPLLKNCLVFEPTPNKNSLQIPVKKFDIIESDTEEINILSPLPFITENTEKCIHINDSKVFLRSENNLTHFDACCVSRQPVQNSAIYDETPNCTINSSKFDFVSDNNSVSNDESYGLELIDEFLDKPEYNDKMNSVLDSLKHCVNNSASTRVELSAVNFFSILLGRYNIGVSAQFLRKHLTLASEEVKTYVDDNFPNDILPFFQKHDKVFYVSEYSNNIYMIKSKNSSFSD